MISRDTSADAQSVADDIYRNMPIAQKAQQLFSACQFGRKLAIAGIKQRNPKADEKQIWQIWARQNLGNELFEEVYGTEK